jgi:integrase
MNRPRKHDKHLPRGMYFRHGAYYLVRKGRWEPLGRDLPGAMKKYADTLEAPKGGMADLIDVALVQILRDVRPNTVKCYQQAARRLKKALQEFSPQQVRARHVAQIKQRLASTPNAANHCLTVLRLVFAYAVENQLVDDNPVTIKPFRTKKRSRLISLQEYSALYAKAGPRLQVIMDLCIRTGQRISDVLAIRRSDLTPEGIRFKQQKTDAKGVVPWTSELRAVVDRAKGLGGNLTALTLLYNRRGRPLSYGSVFDQWKRARRAAGIPDARIHDLRAVAATWAKKQGKNATTLLMHANAQQTERYLRDKEELIADGPSFGHLLDKAK